jgi:hypothetical protein
VIGGGGALALAKRRRRLQRRNAGLESVADPGLLSGAGPGRLQPPLRLLRHQLYRLCHGAQNVTFKKNDGRKRRKKKTEKKKQAEKRSAIFRVSEAVVAMTIIFS